MRIEAKIWSPIWLLGVIWSPIWSPEHLVVDLVVVDAVTFSTVQVFIQEYYHKHTCRKITYSFFHSAVSLFLRSP